MQGRIINFSEEKGYGFISVTFKERIFFHFSNWVPDDSAPVIGQVVNFDVAPGRKPGLQQAINVKPVSGPIAGTEALSAVKS